ncbi:MAG: sulfurtransferase complex subunit TusC [Gammaproteobacteria bacterium]|nr:sulfurtransferase complex subunit TusC [Gammaproteobacteria bacterium]
MSDQPLLYVFQSAPYSNAHGPEGLDAVLIGSAFEQSMSLLFLHDGVFQLRAGQDISASDLKRHSKTFRALQDLGVEHFYVHDQALLARGLTPEQLMVDVELLDAAAVATLLQQQHRVMTF